MENNTPNKNPFTERFNEMSKQSKEASAKTDAIIDESVKRMLENYDPELLKKIVRDASRQILDHFIEEKLCPLLTKFGWKNCGELEKGEEEFCSGGKFVNCPAFDRYVSHEIIAAPQRKKNQKRKVKDATK
jgi:hypothetical protein